MGCNSHPVTNEANEHKKNMNTTQSIEAINLDDEAERDSFLSAYGHAAGITVSRSVGYAGKGMVRAGKDLRNYAWNKRTACACRLRGDIGAALMYEGICERIYGELPESLRW
jgi:hypothetical protein